MQQTFLYFISFVKASASYSSQRFPYIDAYECSTSFSQF